MGEQRRAPAPQAASPTVTTDPAPSDAAAHEAPAGTGPVAAASGDAASAGVVDWSRTVRRLRRSLTAIAVLVVLGWLTISALQGGISARVLAELTGLGLLAGFVAEVVVVGGGAVRGMLTAGARGERLAGRDVSLLPPQLTRRRR